MCNIIAMESICVCDSRRRKRRIIIIGSWTHICLHELCQFFSTKLSNRDVISLHERNNSKKDSPPIRIVVSVAGSAGFENGYPYSSVSKSWFHLISGRVTKRNYREMFWLGNVAISLSSVSWYNSSTFPSPDDGMYTSISDLRTAGCTTVLWMLSTVLSSLIFDGSTFYWLSGSVCSYLFVSSQYFCQL